MGLLSATGKAAKKLADEWDEAAWLKDNPRPEGTKRGNPEVKKWMQARTYAKNKSDILQKGKNRYHGNVDKERARSKAYREKNLEKEKARKKKYYEENKDSVLARTREYKKENKEKTLEDNRRHYAENKEHYSEVRKKYRSKPENIEREKRNRVAWEKANPDKVSANRRKGAAKVRAAKLQRTPEYSSNSALKDIYGQAGLLSKTTGTPYEVDHVIPLQGETVSGLHVPGNLMIVPKGLNRSKTNAFTPGDDPMRFNAQAEKNIAEQNAEGLLSGIALPSTAGLAGLLTAGQSEDADAGFVTRGGKTLLEAWHGGPNKIDGSFRLSDKDVGIHLADNESLATNAAVKSGFERGIGRDQIQTAPYLIDANGNQVHKISASSNRFDAVEIIDELIASGKINKARGSQMIDEILEIEDSALDVNEYLKSNLEDASGIRALEYKNSYDAGPTWEDIEKGVFESDVKPAPSYMVFNPDYIQKGNADSRLLAGIAGTTAAGLAAPMVKDSGFISAPRSEGLMDLTMAARGLERRLEGSPASLLFPEGLVNYLETVNRRTEDPNAMTRIMGLVDLIP
jgi:hypothetical protein